MSERLSITKYGDRYWAVWLDGQLLAVTLYKKGATAIASKENIAGRVHPDPMPATGKAT